MSWVSLDRLKERIIKRLKLEKGNLTGITHAMIQEEVEKYPKREKKPCNCENYHICDCVVFGLEQDSSIFKEYEYLVGS